MAFTSTITESQPIGRIRLASGTYTSDGGTTGGDITTGLTSVYALFLQPKGSSILANQPVVNETMPMATDGPTIVTTANETGTWLAYGI